jgi:hypothetical protein
VLSRNKKRFVASVIVVVLALSLGILLFPRYRASLTSAPGYKLYTVTKSSFPENVLKVLQLWSEHCPCNYELIGWDAHNWLHYTSTCNNLTQSWQYNPESRELNKTEHIPSRLYQAVIPRAKILEIVRVESINPPDLEPVTRPFLLRGEGYASRDTRWIALVAQHISGPQDVIVLAKE